MIDIVNFNRGHRYRCGGLVIVDYINLFPRDVLSFQFKQFSAINEDRVLDSRQTVVAVP